MKEKKSPCNDNNNNNSKIVSINESESSVVEVDFTNHFKCEEIFCSREQLVDWVQIVGKSIGTVVVIKKSDSGQGTRGARITFACERGGLYKESCVDAKKEKARKSGTKKIGCPFALRGVKLLHADEWTIYVLCGIHNHPIAQIYEGHSFAGRLNDEEKQLLLDMSYNGAKPKQILVALKGRNQLNASTLSTIYNARHHLKIMKMCGKSHIQELFQNLNDFQYVEQHRTNSGNKLADLFWAKCFPHIFLMDCTYKTNRFNMSLLEILGVTSTNLTFSVAFAFLDAEKEENYMWALQCLKIVLDPEVPPSVIVTDRELALMNALKVRNNFIFRFNELVSCGTDDEYTSKLEEFQTEFSDYPGAVAYVIKNWLSVYKEHFVATWTDRYTHFGNTTTNRAEGAHSKLKKNLGTSQGNFSSAWNAIHRMLVTEHVEIKASFERSLILVRHEYKIQLYDELRGFVSRTALEIISEHLKVAVSKRPDDKESCGCRIRLTHGLSCACEIARYKVSHNPIPISCIHVHWKKLSDQPHISPSRDLDCEPDIELFKKAYDNVDPTMKMNLLRKLKEVNNQSSTLISEPKVRKKSRGRPKTPEGKKQMMLENSTKRDPSQFEYALGYVGAQGNLNFPRKKRASRRQQIMRGQNPSVEKLLPKIPRSFWPFISSFINVVGDGNCGYRVVANFVYGDEEQWLNVRQQLISELEMNMSIYIAVFGSVDRYNELYGSLHCTESPAPASYWMTMPEMGHVIASRYNVPIVYISHPISMTLLPLQSYPFVQDPEVLVIAFVDNNHFVRLKLNSNSPFPPVNIYWSRFRKKFATSWGDMYEEQLRRYKNSIEVTNGSPSSYHLD